jgi:hypothetical protein
VVTNTNFSVAQLDQDALSKSPLLEVALVD